jgi:Flp pilus assembly protein TadG
MAAMNLIRRAWTSERGAELLEFAFALPILLFVLAGIVDFGILFQRYEVVTNAAREGARVGILPDYDEPDVTNRVTSYLGASGLTAARPPDDIAYDNVEVTPGGATMSVVSVTVQYPHNFLFVGPIAGLFGGTGPADIMLTAASTMRREIAAAP